MIALCLGLAGAVWTQLVVAEVTLAWQHSVERLRWEEDYRLGPDGLRLTEARVLGSGAGMEAPPGARLSDGAWRYRPELPPLQPLRLARGTATADYELCQGGACYPLSHWLGEPAPERPLVELWSCESQF